MQTILVLNPKGGSGKSTLSINLAGFFASWGVRVTVADFDAQATVLDWLAARPASCSPIKGVAVAGNTIPDMPETDYLLLDVPSGHYGDDLVPWLSQADRIVVPVLPSPNDIRAAKRFLYKLATDERYEQHAATIAIVANRVRENTQSYKLLKSFLESIPMPCVATLRDTQNYVMAAQHGLSIFELPSYRVKKDLQQWQPLVNWLCMLPTAKGLLRRRHQETPARRSAVM